MCSSNESLLELHCEESVNNSHPMWETWRRGLDCLWAPASGGHAPGTRHTRDPLDTIQYGGTRQWVDPSLARSPTGIKSGVLRPIAAELRKGEKRRFACVTLWFFSLNAAIIFSKRKKLVGDQMKQSKQCVCVCVCVCVCWIVTRSSCITFHFLCVCVYFIAAGES